MSSRIRGVSKQCTRTFLVWLGVRFLALGQRLITRTVRASSSGKQSAFCVQSASHHDGLRGRWEELAKGGSFLKESAFTSSTLSLFRGAVDLCELSVVTTPSVMGARHLPEAIIYRPTGSGHLDDLQKWGFVPAYWSEKFVQYVDLRNPRESFWTSVHQQVYRSHSPVSSSDAAPSVKEEPSRPVAPDGQADSSESEAARFVQNCTETILVRSENIHSWGAERFTPLVLIETGNAGRLDKASLGVLSPGGA